VSVSLKWVMRRKYWETERQRDTHTHRDRERQRDILRDIFEIEALKRALNYFPNCKEKECFVVT
jgi:hypothetical protein